MGRADIGKRITKFTKCQVITSMAFERTISGMATGGRRFRIEPRRGEGGLKPAPTQANRFVHLLLEWMAGGWGSGLGWRYDRHGECGEISGAERVRSDVQSDVWVFSGDGAGAEVYLFARGAGTEEREDLSLSPEPDGGRREAD